MRLTLAAMALLGVLFNQNAVADSASTESPTATVLLIDGRVVTGRVLATSDATQLDVLLASDSVQVTTHVDWSDVLALLIGDQQISVEAFRDHLANYVASVEPLLPTETSAAPLQSIPEPGVVPVAVPVEIQPPVDFQNVDKVHKPRHESPRLAKSIDIHVRLANWDQDAEPDGLLLELYVFDERGWSLHVPGQFSATLTGLRNESIRGRIAVDGKPTAKPLERWDIRIAASEFQNGRAVVKLPFRRPGRNHEFDVAPFALLQVSYGVASVGVFRATQPDVPIQQTSFFRDELFLSTGDRHLPSERRTPHRQRIPRSLRGL